MTEQTIYIYIGMVIYFMGCIFIGMPIMLVWMHWAKREIGLFWDYSLDKAMRLYYPRFWSFMESKVSRMIMVIFWPIALPSLIAMWTKSLIRNRDFEATMSRLVSR